MVAKKSADVTACQRKFLEAILAGSTRESAYLEAYPKSSEWTRQSRETSASRLLNKPNVKIVFEKMQAHATRISAERALWNRDISAKVRLDVIERIQVDTDQRSESIKKEAESTIENPPPDASAGEVERVALRILQKPSIDPAAANAIARLADGLDRLFGLDETSINACNVVVVNEKLED